MSEKLPIIDDGGETMGFGEVKANTKRGIFKEDTRPMRYSWAPGGYVHHCKTCGDDFIGDKRATLCADCAYALPDPTPVKDEPPTDPRDAEIAHLTAELSTLRAELEKRHELVKDLCEEDIKVLNIVEQWDDSDSYLTRTASEVVQKAIDTLRAELQAAKAWVKCEDRLPERFKAALIIVDRLDQSIHREELEFYIAHCNEGHWFELNGESVPGVVIAWRDLPPPPEGKG